MSAKWSITWIAGADRWLEHRPAATATARGWKGRPALASSARTVETFIGRLMTLDANKDGTLTTGEVADVRIVPLLKRADTNNDGVVTKAELTTFYTKETAVPPTPGRGGPPGFGPGPGKKGPGAGPPAKK